jgi:hypothetical protein
VHSLAFLCIGCSELRLVAQIEFPEGSKHPQAGEVFGDSLFVKELRLFGTVSAPVHLAVSPSAPRLEMI